MRVMLTLLWVLLVLLRVLLGVFRIPLLIEVCCEVATWGTFQVGTHLTGKPNPFYIEQLVHF